MKTGDHGENPMLESQSRKRPPNPYTVLCRILREQSSLWDAENEKFVCPEAELLWAVVECALRELQGESRSTLSGWAGTPVGLGGGCGRMTGQQNLSKWSAR
jgi:hypothetical protein